MNSFTTVSGHGAEHEPAEGPHCGRGHIALLTNQGEVVGD